MTSRVDWLRPAVFTGAFLSNALGATSVPASLGIAAGNTLEAVFGAFDCPSGNQVMPKRSRSNTPLQALNLFNSNFVLQQADLLAGRLRQEAGEQIEAQIVRAFELMYGREPDGFERKASTAMIRDQGLDAFCRALYNTSEFLFVF